MPERALGHWAQPEISLYLLLHTMNGFEARKGPALALCRGVAAPSRHRHASSRERVRCLHRQFVCRDWSEVELEYVMEAAHIHNARFLGWK